MSDLNRRSSLSFPRVAAARGIPAAQGKTSGFFVRCSHARENDRRGEAKGL